MTGRPARAPRASLLLVAACLALLAPRAVAQADDVTQSVQDFVSFYNAIRPAYVLLGRDSGLASAQGVTDDPQLDSKILDTARLAILKYNPALPTDWLKQPAPRNVTLVEASAVAPAAWVPPPADNSTQVVAPAGVPETMAATSKRPASAYSPQPKLKSPPMLPNGTVYRKPFVWEVGQGCPESRNVKVLFGAKGDGITNDYAALRKASDSKLDYLYFPPGVYRLSTSLTFKKPLLMGFGTALSIDAKRVVTLKKQMLGSGILNSPVFIGGGRARFMLDKGIAEIHPDWYQVPGASDNDGLVKSVENCENSCVVMLNRAKRLDRAWVLKQNGGVFATMKAHILPGASPEGVVLRPGLYSVPIVLSHVNYFADYAIKVLGGVWGANIQLGYLGSNNQGLVFENGGPGGWTRAISNVWAFSAVAHLNRNSVVFRGADASDTTSNVFVLINFSVYNGAADPGGQSSGVLFAGAPVTLQNTEVVYQAIDPAQFATRTNFVALQNLASGPVNNFMFRSDVWTGGFEPPGRLIDGAFNNLEAYISLAGPFSPTYQYWSTGSNNLVSTGSIDSAYWNVAMVESPNALGWFNGGNPLNTNQLVYVNARSGSDWLPGQSKTFYMSSQFAQFNIPRERFDYVPKRDWNPGLVVTDTFTADPSRNGVIAVTVRNASPNVIPAWVEYRFGLQMGP